MVKGKITQQIISNIVSFIDNTFNSIQVAGLLGHTICEYLG